MANWRLSCFPLVLFMWGIPFCIVGIIGAFAIATGFTIFIGVDLPMAIIGLTFGPWTIIAGIFLARE